MPKNNFIALGGELYNMDTIFKVKFDNEKQLVILTRADAFANPTVIHIENVIEYEIKRNTMFDQLTGVTKS